MSLKKQNSLIKKKINISNVLFSFNAKKTKLLEKSNNFIEDNQKYNKGLNVKYLNFFFYLDMFSVNTNKLNFSKMIDLKKKLKKLILMNRKVLNMLNFSKTRYSKHLTNTILIKSKQKSWWNVINFEMQLFFILINSGLIFSYFDSFNFLKNKCVYLNRVSKANPYITVKKGDLIELTLSKNYFIYLFFLNNNFEKNINKLKNKLSTKFKNKDSSSEKSDSYMLKLLKNNYIFKKNIPNYMEVDFFVLSVFIVKNINNYLNLSFINRKFIVFYMYKLYNWKWIS